MYKNVVPTISLNDSGRKPYSDYSSSLLAIWPGVGDYTHTAIPLTEVKGHGHETSLYWWRGLNNTEEGGVGGRTTSIAGVEGRGNL